VARRNIKAKSLPREWLPSEVTLTRPVYFYPDVSPFSDDVLIGTPKNAHIGQRAKVIRGVLFSGTDFKLLVQASLGGQWYAWVMPYEIEAGERHAIVASIAASRRRKNPSANFERNKAMVARLRSRYRRLALQHPGFRGKVSEAQYLAANLTPYLGKKRVFSLRGENRRRRNRLGEDSRYLIQIMRKGGRKHVLTWFGAGFSDKRPPKTFSSLAAAEAVALRLVKKVPALKTYHVWVTGIDRNLRTHERRINRKKNPRELAAAKKIYRDFREAEPSKVVKGALDVPKALATIGPVEFIGYGTTHGRRSMPYIHTFAEGSRPMLAAGAKRNQLFLVGGRYTFTRRGITDLDARGRAVDARSPYEVKLRTRAR